MKRMTCIITALALGIMLTACGGSDTTSIDSIGGEKVPVVTYSYVIRASSDNPPINRSTITIDEYGLQQPSILYSISVPEYLRLTTSISGSEIPGWLTSSVMTIYVSEPMVVQPGVEYSFDPTAGIPFPGIFAFFNGALSTQKLAVSGTLTFTSWGVSVGSLVEGHYDILMEDDNPIRSEKPLYRIAGNFSFSLGTQSTIEPSPEPIPATASTLYQERCQGCHWLSEKDILFAKEGPILADKGYEANLLFSGNQIHHEMAPLNSEELFALRTLLNAL